MSERNTKSYKKVPKSYNTEQARKDRELGKQGEVEILALINEWFGCQFQEDKQGWREMDFLCIERRYACELKTRRIALSTYPTILISTNKIVECIRLNGLGFRTFIIFNLTDDVYFYEFIGREIPSQFIKSDAVRKDRGYEERHKAYFIPTYLLKKFSSYKDKSVYDETENILRIVN